ncbi:uncharacterized protein LOC111254339 isoform X2 [Varroa destructor]|uniref:Uncharacterized protein n=1 Tax=Varroa destructor TaxID=109461 RepID=A0A7M7KU09_VARDE|nr:uncharacterized protein LOC111254339 isoform X2 [Varroa destructor]
MYTYMYKKQPGPPSPHTSSPIKRASVNITTKSVASEKSSATSTEPSKEYDILALVKGLKHMKLPQISPPQNKIAMINPYLNAADPVNQLDPRLSVSKKKPKSARKRRPRRSKSKRRRSCRVRGSVTHRRRQAAEPRRDRT